MENATNMDALAMRLDRIADWNGHLRASERSDLRQAAHRLRDLADEVETILGVPVQDLVLDGARSTAASNTAATSRA